MTDHYQFHRDRSLPAGDAVFVFGSNLQGRHGKAAAQVARDQFGAIKGKGAGAMGRCYAIPTKSNPWRTLSIETIREHVERFKQYARSQPHETFFVTRIGCGEAGYKDHEIAPLFRDSPGNCNFAQEWRPYL